MLVAAEGVAVPSEIDAVFKDVLKAEKGPFELMDIVGLDVVLDVEEHYAAVRANIDAKPREYLKAQIKKGRLGVKNGMGFYDHTKPDPPATNGTSNGTVNGASNGTSNGASNVTTNSESEKAVNGNHEGTTNAASEEPMHGASNGTTSEAASSIFKDNWTFGPKVVSTTCTVIVENGQE